MTDFEYVPAQKIRAVQWRQDNFAEVVEFLSPYVEHDTDGKPYVYESYVEPYFLRSGSGGGYNIVQFQAWGDMEVYPGQWIVIFGEPGEDDGEIVDDAEFTSLYKKA
jgi:hypothetical protein